MKFLSEVNYRGVTAVHYLEDKKYMIWYHKKGNPSKTVGFVQVRGLKEPLTDIELKIHIDKLWERYYAESRCEKRGAGDRGRPSLRAIVKR